LPNTDIASQVEQRSGFWIIADAVKKFYDKHQCLPLPGKVPDMKAQSKVYIQLQSIYKAKARKDAAEILETVRSMPGGQNIDPAEVELFCKNAAFVKLIDATGGKISRADRLRAVAGMLSKREGEGLDPVPALARRKEVEGRRKWKIEKEAKG
jgi:amyloid beta precursor protein binding protein 1